MDSERRNWVIEGSYTDFVWPGKHQRKGKRDKQHESSHLNFIIVSVGAVIAYATCYIVLLVILL